MRLTLAQLRKLSMPYSFDEELDLSEDLDGFEDIISSNLCKVHTVIRERGIDTYLCEFDIHIEVTMQDSVTLEGVPYVIETKAEEIFTTDDSIEDAFMIDGIDIDTKEAILTNLLIAKPMSISNTSYLEEEEIEEEAEYVNPAFASLKDLL